MWTYKFIPESDKDLSKLDKFVQEIVIAGIVKVSQNPLPDTEGGHGKPLGKKRNVNLTNFLKIKYKDINIRVVYTLARKEQVFNIIVIDTRSDSECYDLANLRKNKYGKDLFKDIFN